MSEIATLLSTDVVDSTRLNETLGDAVMGPLWKAHDAAARSLMQDWNGQEVARSDGFLVLFPTALSALQFATAYHKALRTLDFRLKARVGLHVGEIVRRENSAIDRQRGAPLFEIDGVSVPIVSRVMGAAIGGQTLLTEAGVQALGSTSFRVKEHGHWRLKGITEPLELFEAGDRDAPFEPPPDSIKAYRVVRRNGEWTPLQEIPHNLPAERDAFVGREEPLRVLQELLDSSSRLVTLLGIGGIGKTRLALRHARTWLGDYPGGAWFCDLSTARSSEGIVSAVAQALNVQLNKSDPVAQIAAAIASRGQCLLILDNFEQVARHAEETLGRWLAQAADAKFIVTSREVLGIVGEQTQVLAPLAVHEGARLFIRRATAASARSVPSAADKPAVDALVMLLDGLPLAIELAAARSRVMSPTMLLERMNERFTILASRGGRLDRQVTLRSTLDWSWDLLSEQEKAALAQLSVFEGGFTLSAVETVLRVRPGERMPTALDLLQSLMDKSFVRQADDERFGLLQTVQEYAAQHLHTTGRFEGSGPEAAREAETRHGGFYAKLTEGELAMSHCVELDNLAAACRRAVARDDFATATVTLVLTWAAVELRGPFKLGLDLSCLILASPRAPADPRVRLVNGSALAALGKISEAQSSFEAALLAACQDGDRISEAHALTNLGNLSANAGGVDEARTYLTAALTLARTTQVESLECKVLNGLGTLNGLLGRTDAARADFEAGLALARRINNRRWEGGILANLGNLQYAQGRLDEACASYEAGIAIARELSNRQWEGNALCNLGLMCQLRGDAQAARRHHESALRVAREIGHARLEAVVLCNAGITEQESDNFDDAQRNFESALRAATDLHDEQSQGRIFGLLGLLNCQRGHHSEGRRLIDQGKQHFKIGANDCDLIVLLCQSAEAYLLAGDEKGANREFKEAEGIVAAVGPSKPFELATALARAQKLLLGNAQAAPS
jgi:predicted ATPase/class 3 adenylate cyclase/Tfp pilus assembly protein PilF